uniref:AIG1-type G domain-containing protein n=1 Tax=Seriola lalandi dorsalis TaxID=1841481 RepID=A0A3B4YGG4_SERLL
MTQTGSSSQTSQLIVEYVKKKIRENPSPERSINLFHCLTELKDQEFGTLTRNTVGEQNLNKINKTILLVGETGTGKSTLINTLVNYAMGVEFDDDIWFEIVEDEKGSQSESQTSDVIVYEIFDFKENTLPYSLTIIDTPGYGDTKNEERDFIISQRLFDLFCSEEGVHEVNAVGLVMKASENRLSDRLMYIFSSVMSLFGKDLEKNIVALVTHSNGRKPKKVLEALEAAKIKCARDEKNQPLHFLFNNCQKEDRTDDREVLEQADKVTVRGMSQFKDFLEKTAPQKLEKTVDVLNKHVRLTACIQNLQERIGLIELKQTEIKQTKEALKKYEEEMKKNEKFTAEVDEVYRDKEPIDSGMGGFLWLSYTGAVTCKVCKENCHHPGCRMAWYPRDCKVMKGGRCTVCTNKCPASDHVKENWIYINKTRKVQKTLQGMKDKYEENKAESEKKSSLLENLEKEMKELTDNKDQYLEESYQHVVRLEQIALNVNSVSTHVHLDFLIEKMKERGDTEKVQKLEEMRSRVDERALSGIQYASRRFYKLFKIK